MKDQILGFLSKTLNMDAERLAEILFKKADDQKTLTENLNDNAVEELLRLDADRVSKLRPAEFDAKKIADDQYKRGQKEALEGLEKTIRAEFKTDSTAQGLDLVKQLFAAAQTKKLGDDEVKIHPLFMALEADRKKEADALKTDFEKQVAELKGGFERKDRFGRVSTDILKVFESLRPVLPANPTAAATVRQEFVEKFGGYEFVDNPQGGYFVVRDSKPLEDAQGYKITLDQLVKNEATSRFDFAAQDPKGNAGNGGGSQGANGSGATVAKTEAEFQNQMFNAKTVEERAAFAEAYKTVNPTFFNVEGSPT